MFDFVMAGHSPSKTGVDALLLPAIHVFDPTRDFKTWMPTEVGPARLPDYMSVESRVNPTCDDKRGHDVEGA
jgi:hypothetical protein